VEADDCGWGTGLRRPGATFSLHALTASSYNHDFSGSHPNPHTDYAIVGVEGLTGSHPTVLVPGPHDYSVNSVEGTVTGGSGGPVRLYGAGSQGPIAPVLAGTDGGFSVPSNWEGIDPLTLTVRAFEVDDAGTPAHYLGYGETSATIQANSSWIPPWYPPSRGASVALEPVSEGMVTGLVTAAPELQAGQLSLRWWLKVPEGMLQLGAFPAGSAEASAPSVVFPIIPGAHPWLGVRSEGPAGRSWDDREVQVPSQDVPFDLPAPVTLLEPTEGASVTQRTRFSWTSGSDGGHTALQVGCQWSTSGMHSYTAYSYVATLEAVGTQASLNGIFPDGGTGIPRGTACWWSVIWQPEGGHFSATPEDADGPEHRGSQSQIHTFIFQ
jgi:hypothetical protein